VHSRKLQEDQPAMRDVMHVHPQTRAQVWQGCVVHFEISQSIPIALKNQVKKSKGYHLPTHMYFSASTKGSLCSEYLVFNSFIK